MKRLAVLFAVVALLLGSLSSAALAGINTAKQKQMDPKLVAVTDTVMEKWAGRDDAKLVKELAKLGWTKMPTEPEMTPMSASGSGTVTPQGIFKAGNGAYLVQGDWTWKSGVALDSNSKPADYFGLGLTNSSNGAIADASPTSMNMAIYDQYGNSYRSYGNPSVVRQSGATYTVSDQIAAPTASPYIGYRGSIWYYLPYKPAGVANARLTMEWKHTYTSPYSLAGSLSSVTLEWPWKLSATFTGTKPYEWSAVQNLYIPDSSW